MLGRRLKILVANPPAPEGAPLAASDLTGTLEWRQLGRWWSPCWELWSGESRVATFVPEGRWTRHAARFRTARSRWRVRRRGIFGRVDAGREDAGEPELRYRPGFFHGGRIERGAGSPLRWRPDWLARGGRIENQEGFVMLRVTRHGPFRTDAGLEVEEAGRRLPDIDGLVALSWWLAVNEPRHHGAH